ncbi:MAG TPA: SIS domain-containing protein [Candidatus Eisenbacteria bacterium]|nr:SIS domain-containing protein [Candidatus Eisenbacteria bacterium]
MTETQPKGSPWIAGVEPPADLLDKSMVEIYEMECREQPERLAQLLHAYEQDSAVRDELNQFATVARSQGPVLFIGMGASYCCSITGTVHLQSHGRSSFAVDASEWLHYSEAWDRAALSLLVTTSGESAELVKLCHKGANRPLGLLCNNEKSACWSLVPHRLPILAGPEYGNATKTYTNATGACVVLASHILGRVWQNDVQQVLHSFSSSLEAAFSRKNEMEEFCRGAANIELVGRGAAYGGAIMGALCIREMTGNRAAPHSGGGFRHGPILDVNGSHVAMIFALGRTADLGVTLAQDCLKRGGKVILVETEERAPSERLLPIRIASVPEPWEGITSVAVPQALTLAIAQRFGANLKPRFQYGEMKE